MGLVVCARYGQVGGGVVVLGWGCWLGWIRGAVGGFLGGVWAGSIVGQCIGRQGRGWRVRVVVWQLVVALVVGGGAGEVGRAHGGGVG